MTLLSIVQQTCDSVGITRPTAVASSTNTGTRQLFALLNEVGRELTDAAPWQALVREKTHTTVATQSQGAITTLMPGYHHKFYDTMWNRTNQHFLGNPTSPRGWQAMQARSVSGPYYDWRHRQGNIYFYPTPTAGETVAWEYLTTYWCQSSAAADQSAFATDTDVGVLDERLLKLGLIYMYKAAKGLPYLEDQRNYERAKDTAIANDGGMAVLRDQYFNDSTFPVNMAEGNWNIP